MRPCLKKGVSRSCEQILKSIGETLPKPAFSVKDVFDKIKYIFRHVFEPVFALFDFAWLGLFIANRFGLFREVSHPRWTVGLRLHSFAHRDQLEVAQRRAATGAA